MQNKIKNFILQNYILKNKFCYFLILRRKLFSNYFFALLLIPFITSFSPESFRGSVLT